MTAPFEVTVTAIADLQVRRNAALTSARALLYRARADRGPHGVLTPDEDQIFTAHVHRLRELDTESNRLIDHALAELLESVDAAAGIEAR